MLYRGFDRYYGIRPKLLIGGDLTFAGEKIDNKLGRFEVAGNTTYVGSDPVINNETVDLKILATWYSGGHNGRCAAWGVDATKNKVSAYCGISTGGVASGSDYKMGPSRNSKM